MVIWLNGSKNLLYSHFKGARLAPMMGEIDNLYSLYIHYNTSGLHLSLSLQKQEATWSSSEWIVIAPEILMGVIMKESLMRKCRFSFTEKRQKTSGKRLKLKQRKGLSPNTKLWCLENSLEHISDGHGNVHGPHLAQYCKIRFNTQSGRFIVSRIWWHVDPPVSNTWGIQSLAPNTLQSTLGMRLLNSLFLQQG